MLGFWAIFAAIIGAWFVPWPRIFSRDFWTHPTIAQMQADMLREVWAEWRLKKYGSWMSQAPIAFGHVRRDVAPPMLIKPGQMRYVLHDGPIFIGSTGGAGTINGRKV